MAIRFYDEALANKIQDWIKDPNLRILKPDEASRLFQIKADTTNDRPLKLPFIALSRDRDIEILATTKQEKTFRGYSIILKKETIVPLNVIPIRLSYQLDIYAREMAEADEYIRNFVFNFVNSPSITITLPYNGINFDHHANVYMSSMITDNSDIPEKLFADQFVRITLKLEINDAYLFSMPIKEPSKLVEVELEVKEKTTKEVIDKEQISQLSN